MGSRNDVLINPANGHRVRVADVEGINQQVRDLRAKLWNSLQTMLRELDHTGTEPGQARGFEILSSPLLNCM